MKKIFTLAAAFLASAVAFNAAAGIYVVNNKNEWANLIGSFTSSSKQIGDRDTILITAGEDWGMDTWKNCPSAGKIWFIGAADVETDVLGNVTKWTRVEEFGALPVFKVRQDADHDGIENSDLGWFFENVHIKFTGGNQASSGQCFYFNKRYFPIDSMVFRNCEISDIPRTLIRTVPPQGTNEAGETVNIDGGTINYFEMSGCRVHDNMVLEGNNWPLVYFGYAPSEIVFKNNTFYDMPYCKFIFQMSYVNFDYSGRLDCAFTFENNTVMVGSNNNYDLINTGAYLGQSSTFDIHNNFILWPEGVEQTRVPYLLRCNYGMVYANNNVIEGYKEWNAGNNVDSETGEPTWLISDTTGNYTMADVELAWSDFYDIANNNFSLLKDYKVYTAGKEGTFIGAEEWYIDAFPTKITVNVGVEGSTSATINVSPVKDIYFVGDEIEITVDLHDGLNTFIGWSDGVTEMNRTIVLSEDVNLTAKVQSQNYELIWDFDQIAPKGGTITYPAAANHAANPEGNPGVFGMMTVEHTGAYADTTSSQSRNNKTGLYNGTPDVLFVAPLLRTRLDSVAVEKEMAAAGTTAAQAAVDKKSVELTNACCANPDYFYIKISTLGMSGVEVAAVLRAEARMHKVTKMEWSLDNVTYNTLTTVEIDSVGDAWRDAIATLPAAAENQETVYVRWIGDANSPIVGPGMAGTDKIDFDKDGVQDLVSRVYYTYQFIGNIVVTAAAGGSAVETVAADVVAVAQSGNVVTINNVAAAAVEVYSIAGAQVASVPVVAGSAVVTLPGHGVYIVKAGNEAVKVVY